MYCLAQTLSAYAINGGTGVHRQALVLRGPTAPQNLDRVPDRGDYRSSDLVSSQLKTGQTMRANITYGKARSWSDFVIELPERHKDGQLRAFGFRSKH